MARTATKASTTTTTDEKDRIRYFMKVKVTFITPMLGTNPTNRDIYTDFIANADKTTDENRQEELERLGEALVDEKGMTVFMRGKTTKNPTMKDYMWRGYFVEKAKFLAKIPNTFVSSLKAYKQEAGQYVITYPRFPELVLPEGKDVYITEWDPKNGPKPVDEMSELELKNLMEGVAPTAIDTLERPLRAETMQGDRVALAKSETVPVGTTCELTFMCERLETVKLVKECLDEGEFKGTGQWRNSGYGRFTWEILDQWSEKIKPVKVSAEEFPLRG